jgi:DNA-directed RNA polymerase subunit RPC12/RpoP
MALIKCSECSRKISDKAASCPNCGNPMSVKEEPRLATQDEIFNMSMDEYKAYIDSQYEDGWFEAGAPEPEQEPKTVLDNLTVEKMSSIIAAMIIKTAIAVIALVLIPTTEWGISEYIVPFLLIYWATSFFPFALRVTKNWILAIIAWAVILLGLAWVFDSIVDPSMDGTMLYDILLSVFFGLALAFDVFRVIRLARKTKASV